MFGFVYWMADKLHDRYDNGLPDDLKFPEIPHESFSRGNMLRSAGLVRHMLAAGLEMRCGIFDLIGPKYAHRAIWAWRPREIHLMEDLSVAFQLVESQR